MRFVFYKKKFEKIKTIIYKSISTRTVKEPKSLVAWSRCNQKFSEICSYIEHFFMIPVDKENFSKIEIGFEHSGFLSGILEKGFWNPISI